MRKALLEIIKKEIQKKGPIPFDRFMNLTLYHPEFGYYSQANKPRQGKKGDYFTSVSVGTTFSYLLTFALVEMIERINSKKQITLVELGAGDGSLAFSLLEALKDHYPDYYQKIFYIAVEKNKWQRKLIQEKAKSKKIKIIKVQRSLENTKSIEEGIIFANELIDALPVKQVKIVSSGAPLELHIKTKREKLLPIYLPAKNRSLLKHLKDKNLSNLKGMVIEINLAAYQLLKKVASILKSGYFMLIDYGGLEEEIIARSPEGTIRGFHYHKLVTDLTSQPGETDLTSDVNFSDLIKWAEKFGFQTEAYLTQLQFFSQIISKAQSLPWFQKLKPNQLKILIHPDFMGERFKVLTLKR